MKVLFAASEAHPLVKTGGLGDVAGSLPIALKKLRQDTRLVLPAYPQALENLSNAKTVAKFKIKGSPDPVTIIEGNLANSSVKVYLVQCDPFFNRPGNPYTAADGQAWPDNAARFTLFSRALVEIAQNRAGLNWQPEIVHCHDWQTGLVPALLALEDERPATLFTIHNLAYTGSFSWLSFRALELPYELWSMHGLEFHGSFSCLKGGLAFSDHVNTVSPSYAREICTPEFGQGFEHLLQYRAKSLSGILNGVDYDIWNPESDALLDTHFSASRLAGKKKNKAQLQSHFGLEQNPKIPLIGHIGRLVHQKGADLILDILPDLVKADIQFVLLGSGDGWMEEAINDAAKQYPGKVAAHIGYNEKLAHQIEAGSDIFLMPSRFEPCGLNQIYSLRYGTVPVVRRTGGLADTVIDCMPHTLDARIANGFIFDDPSSWALHSSLERALEVFPKQKQWKRLIEAGMAQDFSWKNSARQYLDLYKRLLKQEPYRVSLKG